MKRKVEFTFVILFLAIMLLPFILAHRSVDRISYAENRLYANFPNLITTDGLLNKQFSTEFDEWINDNARFRSVIMEINANLQYYLFHRIAKEDEYIGADHELFLIPSSRIKQIQNADFLTEEALKLYCQKMQEMNDYLAEKDIAFYYMQCYNKETIYPELFVSGIPFDSNRSEAQKVVTSLKEQTQVKVVPIYESQIGAKNDSRLYYKVKDPGHWNEHSAFLAYSALIEMIRKDFPTIRKTADNDYIIETDQSIRDIYGMNYPYPEDSLQYIIRYPQAVEYYIAADDTVLYDMVRNKEYAHLYRNETAANDYKILLLGDSFIRQFIKEDIAEHFQETLSIDWLNLSEFSEIIDYYQPDIVVLESAEYFLGTTVTMVQQWNE